MAELSDAEFLAKWGGVDTTPPAPIATNIIPLTTAAVTERNAPPVIGDTRRRQQALGEQPGVPFHEEGLPTWTDLMAKTRSTEDEKLRYLAAKFGAENVRLNSFKEPVVRIVNPDTGKPEDYPMNPHQLTLNSLTGLAKTAPEIAGALLGEALAPEIVGHKIITTLLKAATAATGMEAGGAAGQIGAETGSAIANQSTSNLDVSKPIAEHLANVPWDFIANLGLVGLVKGAQAAKGIGFPKALGGSGINIPNPVAGTPLVAPARPEFTAEGVAAAQRLQALTGINPELRPSETTGIPVMAMLEQYMERKPAGAQPMIAAGEKREAASKAIQNWMVDPSTLPTDEAVGKGALDALKQSVEPYQKDVELAKFAKEAVESRLPAMNEADRAAAAKIAQQQLEKGQQSLILSKMRVADIPEKGVDLAPTGEALRSKAIAARDEFKAKVNALYDKFYNNPLAKAPIVSGDTLKSSIDALRSDLPKVVRGSETIPIDTPIRSRLDELSAKLENGKVSINDLKQIRTDLNDAIKTGEAIPGVKEGRLKATEAAVTGAITKGLAEIGDADLSAAWKNATTFYRDNVDKYTSKTLAPLFKEADQSASVGNAEFTKRIVTNPDAYTGLREFYGLRSPEMGVLRETVKNKALSDSLTPGGMVDGNVLVRQLKGLKDSNPQLFKDVFADKGNDLIAASDQLGEWQTKVPVEAVDKLLTASGKPAANTAYLQGKIVALQTAQKRLNQEYQNQVIAKFIKGDAPLSELQPDKFVSSLPQAKLSDVKDIMARIESEAPDVAEQLRRKSVQNLLSEARRVATPTDTMAKLKGEPGDLISGIGLSNALGKGDQLEKYKVLLGDLYEPLTDYAKVELLGEERSRIARGVGMLAPGSAMNALVKALTPWESGSKGPGMVKELSGLARDKVFSIAMSSDAIRNWLASPYALKDASGAIKLALVSEPFLKGMKEEFQNADTLAKTLSILKVAFGTASQQKQPQRQQGGLLTDEDIIKKYQTTH